MIEQIEVERGRGTGESVRRPLLLASERNSRLNFRIEDGPRFGTFSEL